MTKMEQQIDIISEVMGNPVRWSEYGLAGERKPSPYAAVDDNSRQLHLHFPSQTVEAAVAKLLDYCREWYPSRTELAEAYVRYNEITAPVRG